MANRYGIDIAIQLSNINLSDISSFSFDLERALTTSPEIKRLALVFFMGMGDFYMIAKSILLLHKRFPNIKLDAYVSKNIDGNNSPKVGECLEVFDCIDNIYYYSGHKTGFFWNYDYTDVFAMVMNDTLVLPMIYDHTKLSRTETVCDFYSIPYEKYQNRLPYIPSFPPTENAKKAFEQIKNLSKKSKAIVFCQFQTRSSNYVYPYAEELVSQLIADDFFVVSYDKVNITNSNFLQLPESISINDTISLLRLFPKNKIFVINTNSVMNSIAASLHIPELILQNFNDPDFLSYTFENAYILTPNTYNRVHHSHQYIVEGEVIPAKVVMEQFRGFIKNATN